MEDVIHHFQICHTVEGSRLHIKLFEVCQQIGFDPAQSGLCCGKVFGLYTISSSRQTAFCPNRSLLR